ncbi:MAG TPA: NrsF family protein [Vicinamibacterales bacterium]|nr:NrsF family protein [Vicinamibacterales bacterium]
MNTEDLIERLGDSLGPVRPLAPPWRRAAVWLACAVAYLCGVVLLAWARGRSLEGTGTGVAQQVALVATAVTASVAAFVSVVPAADRRVIGVSIIPGMLVMGALVWGCIVDVRTVGTLGIGRETDWPCVLSITLGGALLWSLGVAMLRRGAPLTPRVSSLLVGVAAFSVANLEACLSRSHTFTITVLLWHGMTTALFVAAFAQVGRGLLTWKKPEMLLK